MSWKLYKPGQGYWTRMLTGIGGGVFVLAGGLWLVDQLQVVQGNIRLYLQGGVFILVVAVFGTLIYRLAGSSPKTGDFLIATEGEMKKVNWPARKEVTGSTWVVLWTMFLMTSLLYVSDFVFSWFFQAIGVLEKVNV